MHPTDPDPSRTRTVDAQRPPPDGRPAGRPADLALTFTPREVALVERIQAFAARGNVGPFREDLGRALDTGLSGLGNIAAAIRSYPSLREKRLLGGKERSMQTLVDGLVRGGEHAFEWNLPTKAVLSRAFGIAKVNFLTSLQYVIEACQAEEVPSLLEAIAAGVEEAVYTRLAEELLGSLITSPASDPDLKRLAAHRLVELWEGRLTLTMDTLAPILRSAWKARTRAVRVFGTLLGAAEILQMIFADCESCFVEFFSRREVTPEESQAFEEFLFDIPYESLQKVRFRMLEDRLSVVDRSRVEAYLGLTPGALRPTVGDPKDLYVSFRHRRVRAQFRVATGTPGPRRPAEGYILEAILRHELPEPAPHEDTTPSGPASGS